jgi:hypothetical protein
MDKPHTRMTDTAETTADDIVTEEMVSMAVGLLFGGPRRAEDYQAVSAILRAVAPMIAARCIATLEGELWKAHDALISARTWEARHKCADRIAAAIRARGETK